MLHSLIYMQQQQQHSITPTDTGQHSCTLANQHHVVSVLLLGISLKSAHHSSQMSHTQTRDLPQHMAILWPPVPHTSWYWHDTVVSLFAGYNKITQTLRYKALAYTLSLSEPLGTTKQVASAEDCKSYSKIMLVHFLFRLAAKCTPTCCCQVVRLHCILRAAVQSL